MQMRQIPNTGINVSTICLGTMTFGTPVAQPEAIKLTHWAIDNGINFIDTANMYEGYARYLGSPGGVAEEILGKALANRRDHVVLATKVGMQVGSEPEDHGTSSAAIRKHLDLSLKRLATDFVDIYYLHKPDVQNTPLADIIGTLNEAISAGKIRHYGISNYSAEQLAELLRVADENGLPRPVIHQPPYSLLKPDIEKDLLPLCAKEGIAAACYQVLQGGLLTGKYHRGQEAPADSRKAESKWLDSMTDETFDQIEQVEVQAKTKGRSLMEHALKSALELPSVVSLVLGAKRIDQIENLADVIE